jgi:hypothetical protein
MPTMIVAFQTEKEAEEAVARLTEEGIGEIRARVLDSTEAMSYDKNENSSPMIAPGLGSIEVRPTETPRTPETQHPNNESQSSGEGQSATIPTTGTGQGVQVMIEMDDGNEETVRRILKRGMK